MGEFGQDRWEQSIAQSAQDIRYIMDAANDLLRAADNAQRRIADFQYHQFADDADDDKLIREASDMKHAIGSLSGIIKAAIHDLVDRVGELETIAQQHYDQLG